METKDETREPGSRKGEKLRKGLLTSRRSPGTRGAEGALELDQCLYSKRLHLGQASGQPLTLDQFK